MLIIDSNNKDKNIGDEIAVALADSEFAVI